MRRYWILAAIAATLLVFYIPRVVSVVPGKKLNGQILATSTVNLAVMVRDYSLSFGINPAYSSCIVGHESQWDPTMPGDDGNSRGLWQISRVWHPEVSDAVANNPVSSTLWSLAWIKAGHAKQWSTYWKYCSSTPIFF